MSIRFTTAAIALTVLGAGVQISLACDQRLCVTAMPQPTPSHAEPTGGVEQTKLDAKSLFQDLVARYRQLVRYQDVTRMVQVTEKADGQTTSSDTNLSCVFDTDSLQVETAAAAWRKQLGLDAPLKKNDSMAAAERSYFLWLVPHMNLRFSEKPLEEFRMGVVEGFTPTQAERVKVAEKEMIRVELRSGDGLSENCTATFDLFVNPESMLIERVQGEQRMPDGSSCETTLEITPVLAEPALVAPSEAQAWSVVPPATPLSEPAGQEPAESPGDGPAQLPRSADRSAPIG